MKNTEIIIIMTKIIIPSIKFAFCDKSPCWINTPPALKSSGNRSFRY